MGPRKGQVKSRVWQQFAAGGFVVLGGCSSGQTGVGVMHFLEKKTYALLVTFQKTEKEFPPSTMYADYPISRELLHRESQANTAQQHTDGQNLIHNQEQGYTVLVFARGQKKRNTVTVPFTYLGPVDSVSYESERPIKMACRLRYAVSVEMLRIFVGVGSCWES